MVVEITADKSPFCLLITKGEKSRDLQREDKLSISHLASFSKDKITSSHFFFFFLAVLQRSKYNTYEQTTDISHANRNK